jgi:hypothetical protein
MVIRIFSRANRH